MHSLEKHINFSAISSTQQTHAHIRAHRTTSAPGHHLETRLAILRHLQIVLRRKWLIIACTCVALISSTVFILIQPPLYTAIVRLHIHQGVFQVVEDENVSSAVIREMADLRTQNQLLQTRTIAERVATDLNLAADERFLNAHTNPIVKALWNFQGLPGHNDGQGNTIANAQRATAIIMANRRTQIMFGSRLINISYTDPDSDRVQRIANAYAKAYIALNINKRSKANTHAKTVLQDKLRQLKQRLEKSERTFVEFAAREQIVTLHNRETVAQNSLLNATSTLTALAAQRLQAQQRWHQMKNADTLTLPQFLANTIVDGLRAQRNILIRNYQKKLKRFKPHYPAMIRATAQISEIDRQLATEVNTIKNAARAAHQAAKAQEHAMQTRIKRLQHSVFDLQQRSIKYNILKQNVMANRQLYYALLQRYKRIAISADIQANNIVVVDKASRPTQPSSPHIHHALLIAFAFGLGSGLGCAYLLDVIDDTIRTSQDVEDAIGLNVLSAIPGVCVSATLHDKLQNKQPATSEAFRLLATALQFSTRRGLPRTLAVCSASLAEGKPATALALARHCASIGFKVLIIDADLHQPSLHIKLGKKNRAGLADYLSGAPLSARLFKATDLPTLEFMCAGPTLPNPAELLNAPQISSLLKTTADTYDIIIVDAPPILGMTDTLFISRAVEATLLTINAGKTQLSTLQCALRQLQLVRGFIIGATLTNDNQKAAGYKFAKNF